MTLGENIMNYRCKMDWSQEELAEKCNVSRQAVTKWETGESIPTLDKLIALADIFGVSLDELTNRKALNTHERLVEYVKIWAKEDIPDDDDDRYSQFIGKYMSFIKSIEMDPTVALRGLKEIFLD